MTINGINGANTQMVQMGMNQAADSYSRNIQNQISNAQKQLQEISSNEEMTLEEKMKKRQEIQQQISDLNMQLRQHQMEQRSANKAGAKKQQARGSSVDDMPGGTRSGKAGNEGSGLSQTSMTAIISADSSMKQAKVQGSVATKMEGRAGVLESEIKLDSARGNDTSKKQEELADIQQKAQAAVSSQLSTLADAAKTMEKAAQADSRTEKADDKDTKTAGANERDAFQENDADENVSGADTQKEAVSGSEGTNTQADISVSESAAAAGTTTPQPTAYVSVDIRL
ncbi:MAG: FlxA-like family protein [Lachnoclostridium sp.]|nr:FlxA-like family protein [Lachnoclostridium sp.]